MNAMLLVLLNISLYIMKRHRVLDDYNIPKYIWLTVCVSRKENIKLSIIRVYIVA